MGNLHKYKKQCDILSEHARFSLEMRDLMPDDSTFITILRDPATQLRSVYSYYNYKQKFANTLDEFMKQDTNTLLKRGRNHYQFAYNSQSFDLGMSISAMEDDEKIRQHIEFVESNFDIVLIMDYFDEGLILMRDLLGWTNDDVMYFKQNEMKSELLTSSRTDAAKQENYRERANKWNKADKMLYDHFRKKLESKIEKQKTYIDNEVKQFRHQQSQLYKFCVDKRVMANEMNDTRFTANFNSGKTKVYKLTKVGLENETCVNMALTESYLLGTIKDTHLFDVQPATTTQQPEVHVQRKDHPEVN